MGFRRNQRPGIFASMAKPLTLLRALFWTSALLLVFSVLVGVAQRGHVSDLRAFDGMMEDALIQELNRKQEEARDLQREIDSAKDELKRAKDKPR